MIALCRLQDQSAGKLFADEAAAMYERAVTQILKANMLNHFAYADFEEVATRRMSVRPCRGLVRHELWLIITLFWK